jgi:hypothetical protein
MLFYYLSVDYPSEECIRFEGRAIGIAIIIGPNLLKLISVVNRDEIPKIFGISKKNGR